jgi:hypothetical protein
MEQKKNNQERARKYGGTSSYVDSRVPSKAPRQDENASEFVGPSDPDQTRAYNSSDEQGISNRPAKAEHAFPESGDSRTEPDAPPSVETAPKQQGGNRGNV